MAKGKINNNGLADSLSSWITFNSAYRIFGLALIIIGLSFYMSWSILYNTWTDPGLYSVVVIFVVFGVLSVLLGAEKAKLSDTTR